MEVVRSVHTDVAKAEWVGGIMAALGKRPVQVKKDVIGFLGNRIQGALMREALWLIEQRASPRRDIDATVRCPSASATPPPVRSCRRSIRAGTTCAVAKIIWPDLSNADGPPPILQRNVDEGRIGFKTKRGFFEWDDQSIAKERAVMSAPFANVWKSSARKDSLASRLRQLGRDRLGRRHRCRRSDDRHCRAAAPNGWSPWGRGV